jgi:DNA polymerase III epsilon subunit-like protein
MAYKNTYSRHHPGKFGLMIDWETSGSDFGGDSSKNYQGIAFGAVIFNTQTFEEQDTLYRELHFSPTKYKWSEDAEKIHGLTREQLLSNGVSREEGLSDLLEFLLKYFAPNTKIMIAGHNVGFDADFTNQLFEDHGIEIMFHHVMLDSSSLAFALIGEYKSDVVFETLAGLSKRDCHNALADARACLAVFRSAKQIFTIGMEALG